jgi:hypothetical protein
MKLTHIYQSKERGMKRHLLLGALAFFATSTDAVAEDEEGFPIPPGMALTMAVDDDASKPTMVTGIEIARLSDGDRAVAAQFTSGQHADAIGEKSVVIRDGNNDIPTMQPVAPDAAKLSLVHLPSPAHSLLIVENGYFEALTYRAQITVKGQKKPTDVCIVIPKKRGYEHWPYLIEEIEISKLSRSPWREGDPITCN